MRGVNRAVVMGYVGADPKVGTTQGGTKIARVRVATKRPVKERETGEWQEVTDWHWVVAFGGMAGVVEEYVEKGDPVYFEGRMSTRKWMGDDEVDRYTTEVVAETMQLLPTKRAMEAAWASEVAADGEPAPSEIAQGAGVAGEEAGQ